MKKLALFAAVLVAGAASYGQGTVGFANAGATAVSNSVAGGRIATTAFKVSLYYLPWVSDSQVPTTGDFSTAGSVVASSALYAPGLYNNGGVAVRVESIAPAGGNGWFQVRAWELAYGADYATAATRLGALVGTSSIMKVDTGDPTTSPPGAATTLISAGLKTFSVYPVVPEPTAIGLGLLGLGSLLLLRRRK